MYFNKLQAAAGRIIFFFCLFLTWGVAMPEAAAVPHISDFSLGLTRQDLESRQLDSCGDRLCGEVGMGGLEWDGAMVFEQDRLAAITLSGPATEEYMDAAVSGFAQSPYFIFYALADNQAFDFVRQSKEGKTQAEVDRDFADFLRQATERDLSVLSFFYADSSGYAKLTAGVEPEKQPAGCNLTLDQSGITIMIMDFNTLHANFTGRILAAAGTGPDSAEPDPGRPF